MTLNKSVPGRFDFFKKNRQENVLPVWVNVKKDRFIFMSQEQVGVGWKGAGFVFSGWSFQQELLKI